MMAFGDAPNRKRKAAGQFRCATCGALTHTLAVSHGSIVPACREHPEAPALQWSATDQGAAIWISQHLMGGRSWDDIDALIAGAVEEAPRLARVRSLVAVAPLMRDWGGLLPEQRIPAPASARNSLYEARP